MSGSILSTAIMAVAAILIGRFLGPGLYGEYTLTLLVPNLLLLFADLGINAGIAKFAASLRTKGENDRIPRIVFYGLLFQAVVGLAVFILNFALADAFAVLINRPTIGFFMRIVSISIFFQVVTTTAASAFVGLDRTEYSALIANVNATAKTVSAIALVLLGFGVAGAATGFTAGYITASIVAGVLLFFKIFKPKKNSDKASFKDTLKLLGSYGMPLYISVLLVGFTPLYQQVILAFFASNFNVGNYMVASNFLALLTVIPSSITTALLPAFSKLDSSSAETVKVFFRRAKKYTCLLIVPLTSLFIIFSKQIVQIVYGTAFQSASLFLSIGSLPYFLVGIGYLTLVSLFNGLGETRTTLKITIVNFLTASALAPILARTYGVPGVVITSFISNSVAMLSGAYVARTRFKIQFETRTTAKIYLVSAVSAIPPLLLIGFIHMSDSVALVTGGALYILIYITLIPVAKIMGYYELKTATRVVQKIKFLAPIAKPVLRYQERILQARMKHAL